MRKKQSPRLPRFYRIKTSRYMLLVLIELYKLRCGGIWKQLTPLDKNYIIQSNYKHKKVQRFDKFTLGKYGVGK